MDKLYESDTKGGPPLKKAQKKDPRHLSWQKLTWIFTLACLFGVALEVIWCRFLTGRWESRTGLVFGPFNPVYGFGAVLFTLCLCRGKPKPLWLLFLAAAVLGGGFEYLCSWLQEQVLGTVSWDYGAEPFAIGGGRTSLLYAAAWGVLGAVWARWVYPALSRLTVRIPHRAGTLAAGVLALFMAADLTVSFLAVLRQSERRQGRAAPTAIGRELDRRWPDEVLKEIYPSMKPVSEKEENK